ncbi:MAG: tetratricopeptide repeat protein [Tepidisphaeraceae bacterium]
MTSIDAIQSAVQLHRAGRLDDAEAVYRRHVAANPADARVLHLLGTLLIQRRQPAAAVEFLSRAVDAAPSSPDAHFALADALRFAGEFPAAEQAYRKSLALRPLFPPAHNGLGLALVQQGKLDSAIVAWQRALQLKPDHAEALANLGAAYAQQDKSTEAAALLRRAIAANPSFAPAHNNLANVLDEMDDADGAIEHWSKAIELQPNYFDALVNLSKALHLRGREDESLALIERAIAIRPADPDARFLRGLALLTRGDLVAGFSDYRFRLHCPELNLQTRTFPQRAWSGQDVEGLTLLLHTEQGLGDAIQFVRYASRLADRGANVLVEAPPELKSLMQSAAGVESVYARGEALPPFDLHATMLELPRVFGTTLATIPANVPYLAPDPQRAQAWGQIVQSDPPGRRIGLVWSGNPRHSNDRNRSVLLRQLEPLAEQQDCSFYSLQKGVAAGQASDSTLKLKLIDHTPLLTDFAETAALISHLDLVISVDTSVAHLAGAMGTPVWVLLPHVADWRWMTGRNDSPWYPTMRLLRQPTIGDWESVVQAVREMLPTNCTNFTNE